MRRFCLGWCLQCAEQPQRMLQFSDVFFFLSGMAMLSSGMVFAMRSDAKRLLQFSDFLYQDCDVFVWDGLCNAQHSQKGVLWVLGNLRFVTTRTRICIHAVSKTEKNKKTSPSHVKGYIPSWRAAPMSMCGWQSLRPARPARLRVRQSSHTPWVCTAVS